MPVYKRNANQKHGTGKHLVAVTLLLCAALLTACGGRDEPDTPALPETAPPAEPRKTAEEGPEMLSAPLRVVNLAGAPMPAMIPIATRQPNAFDAPVAQGSATNIDGESSIRFPAAEKMCIRAWDPDLRYFPNNFYEVLPGTDTITSTLVVSMVESGTLEAVLMLPDGLPARNENAGIMLFHPVHGPWWPDEADTNERGEVVFARVPPGKYVLRLKVASGATIDVPETYIGPGESTHLGMVHLR